MSLTVPRNLATFLSKNAPILMKEKSVITTGHEPVVLWINSKGIVLFDWYLQQRSPIYNTRKRLRAKPSPLIQARAIYTASTSRSRCRLQEAKLWTEVWGTRPWMQPWDPANRWKSDTLVGGGCRNSSAAEPNPTSNISTERKLSPDRRKTFPSAAGAGVPRATRSIWYSSTHHPKKTLSRSIDPSGAAWAPANSAAGKRLPSSAETNIWETLRKLAGGLFLP